MAVDDDETLTFQSVNVLYGLSSMFPAPPNLETKEDRIRDMIWCLNSPLPVSKDDFNRLADLAEAFNFAIRLQGDIIPHDG